MPANTSSELGDLDLTPSLRQNRLTIHHRSQQDNMQTSFRDLQLAPTQLSVPGSDDTRMRTDLNDMLQPESNDSGLPATQAAPLESQGPPSQDDGHHLQEVPITTALDCLTQSKAEELRRQKGLLKERAREGVMRSAGRQDISTSFVEDGSVHCECGSSDKDDQMVSNQDLT